MKAFIKDEILVIIPAMQLLKLETWCASAGGKEVSGIGTMKYEKGKFLVQEVFLCAGGSEVFTQIEPEHIMEVVKQGIDPSLIKLWWHRHPVGNGLPGPHCWSGTDQNTIVTAPLGSSPALVEWSVSIVRTPYGWVGRMDDYRKEHTLHCKVSQIFEPVEHAHLKKVITERTRQAGGYAGQGAGDVSGVGTLPEKKQGRLWSAKEEVEDWLHRRRRPGRNPKDTNKYRAKMMAALGISDRVYDDIILELDENRLPEHVGEDFGIDIFGLREVGIIDEDELDAAIERVEWVDDNKHKLLTGELARDEIPEDLLDWAEDNWVLADEPEQGRLL